MLVRWPTPPEGQVALNVDGSSYGNPGRAGFGGVFRDHNGSWIIGFSGHMTFADSLEVELLAILNGLNIAWDLGITNLSCRSDCAKALSLIGDPMLDESHKYYDIVCGIREFVSRDWCISFSHTFREGNQCADFMAKLGANAIEDMEVFTEPLPGLFVLLLTDRIGIPYKRL